jgi:membrane associated rhomboid family serine protease
MIGLVPWSYASKAIKTILIINVIVFLIGNLVGRGQMPILTPLIEGLFLVPAYYAQIWRWLSYAFFHLDPMHILFNMLLLWMFGQDVAARMGEKRFWQYYLGVAVFAAAFSIPFYLGGVLGGMVPILGASGALFGVMYAYMKYFPERELYLFMIIPMKVRIAVPLLALMDLLAVGSQDGIAHWVHLGGFAGGALYFYLQERPDKKRKQAFRQAFDRSSVREADFVVKRQHGTQEKFFERDEELERILKKISANGQESLTEKEKKYLIAVSEKKKKQEEDKIINFQDYKRK